MNKVVAVLGFVVIAGYAIPDTSWAHRHILGPPERERGSLIPAERAEFIGPVLTGQGLSQRAELSAWDGVNLMHPDPHHLPGSEPYHPAFYRNNHAPDGAALMFSWPFGGLGNQPISGNANLNRNGEADNLNLR